ncbi:sporulation protein [Streptomyces sp. NBC_01613]|uniref:GerW family sporulation protein n=1 Tax=Streptomyces sp. NBC_01613 TaxID=2975896 RepID=UPI00386DF7F4
MTVPEHETAPASATDAQLTAAHASVTLLDRLAEKLGGRASVTAVYGEPVTVGGVTVIPVAKVAVGIGAGVGRFGRGARGEGGAGGGEAEAKPLGYIEIRDSRATYRAIRDPWTDVIVPVVVLIAGSSLPKIVRELRRRA